MKFDKETAGWISLACGLGLAVDAAVARWFPGTTAAGSEAAVVASVLAFSAAAFGFSSVDRRTEKK